MRRFRDRFGPLALALPLAALVCPGSASTLVAQSIAITNATVHPISAPPVENATVLIRDGAIVAIGTGVEVPAEAERIDATGKVVTPGLIDAGSALGLSEVGAVADTRDYAVSAEDPIRAAFDVIDGINPNSTLIPVNRLGGVTTALTSPSGGLISGRAAVIDLAGSGLDEMLVAPRVAMRATYSASAVGGARGDASLRLREVLDDARFWQRNRAAFDRGDARALAASRLDLEALQPVLAGEMPFIVHVDRASDIEAVLRLADEYGLDLVIRSGIEAWMVAAQLAAAGVPVILKPLTNSPTGFARLGARFDNAKLLDEAGVDVILTTFETHRASDLSWEAGNAIRAGLDPEAALRSVTLAPARAFGIADTRGSLEVGKVANLVIWSGDPFELSTRAEVVIIRGEVMPETSRQRELFERYRVIDADVPPEYR